MSNDHDNSNTPNYHNNNTINESPMISHIAKRSLHIKYKPNNWLPGDLNRLFSSNPSNLSTTTTSKITFRLHNMMQ